MRSVCEHFRLVGLKKPNRYGRSFYSRIVAKGQRASGLWPRRVRAVGLNPPAGQGHLAQVRHWDRTVSLLH